MVVFLVFASSCGDDDHDADLPANNPTNGKTKALFNPNINYGTMTDQDGNIYKTVIIGTQTWMAEDLRTTKYNNGAPIPNITDENVWDVAITGAYANYNNTIDIDTIATFGRLYNWYAVNTGKLAPKGWHVPSDEEWETLTTYLGGADGSAGKLKEIGNTHWEIPNTGATNEIGFTALPGGFRGNSGVYSNIGYTGFWWSSSESDAGYAALFWYMHYDRIEVSRGPYREQLGFSVRLLKD